MLKYNYVINLTRRPDRLDQFLKNKNIMNDIVLGGPIDTIWRDKDKSEEIQQSFRNPSTGWWKALEKSRAYNAEQARLHNIEPTNKDVLSFNYYLRQAMHHWGNFNTEWYRNGAAFNLECDSNEYGIIL